MLRAHDAEKSANRRGRHWRQAPLLAGAALFMASGAPAWALTITPTFGPSITGDPNAAAIENTINAAIGTYEADFSDPINVAITFQEQTSGLGQSSTVFFNAPYTTYYNSLKADAKTANDATALAHLPGGPSNPITNSPFINVTSANLRAVGLATPGVGPGTGTPDGTISLNTSITFPGSPGTGAVFSLLVTTEHQIDEVLGLLSALPNPIDDSPFPEDLFRYDSSGNRSFTTNSTATAFFSIDGTTDLARFDNQNDGGDFGDWQSNPLPSGTLPQVQDAFATPHVTPSLGVELTALDVIGYDLVTPAVTTPEPGTLTLLGSALAGFAALRRRGRSRAG